MNSSCQLLIVLSFFALLGATTAPSTMPATQPSGFRITYNQTGGITGALQTRIIVSPDFKIDPLRYPPQKVTAEQAAAIVELLQKESVMQWPDGIAGRGEFFD